MTKLTRDDVLKLARLSRLRLTENEISQFQDSMSAILAYVEKLQAIDLVDLKPTYQVSHNTNVTRKDAVELYQEDTRKLLEGAPAIEDNHFKVKRMLE